MTKSGPRTSNNLIVLKTETPRQDNKTCHYCKEEKEWRALNISKTKASPKNEI
jgi:hypothetical protein